MAIRNPNENESIKEYDELQTAEIQEVTAQLAQKATKEEVQAVASGSPKGTYTTVSALTTAFPTGNTNIYVVTANGHWYYWSGSVWASGGVYQSEGIADNSITPDMIDVKFNGLDVLVEDNLILEDLTELSRVQNSYVYIPSDAIAPDIFVKINIPSSPSTSSFLLLNGSYDNYISVGGIGGDTVAFQIKGQYTDDAIPIDADYYLRVYNDGTKTAIEVYDMNGDLLTSSSITETFKITSLRFATPSGITAYDVSVFEGLISQGAISHYFFNDSSGLLIDGVTRNGETFNFKTKAKYSYLENGETIEEKISSMDSIKMNGVDVKPAEDLLLLEDRTEVARINNESISVPNHIETVDIFVKITTPSSIASASSFLLLNGSYGYPIGAANTSDGYFSVGVNGVYGPDVIPYNESFYMRIYNDGSNTILQVYNIIGEMIDSISKVENLNITSLRFVTTSGIEAYDVLMFDGLLVDAVISDYFFNISDKFLVESVTKGDYTFNFKTKAKYSHLESGESVEEKFSIIETLLPKSKMENKSLVCFGDSITGNFNPPEDYPTFIANLTGMDVLNVGVGGTRMAYDGSYTNYDPFCMVKIVDALVSGDWTEQDTAYSNLTLQGKQQADNLKTVDLTNTDYITIFHGTNDYTGTLGLENTDDNMDINYFGGAYRYVLDKLLTNYPQLKILLITPMYRDRLNLDDGINSDDQPYRGNFMYDFADKVEEIGKQFHIPVLNMQDNSGINRYTASTYLHDGLHPSLAGREVLGSKIAGSLLSKW